MVSVHIGAKIDEVAERVLLPGDPIRAKNIAENFLSEVHQYTSIRNSFGFTGKYKGIPVSVQATGMGIPSMSIYIHELINCYNSKKLIRVGSCGGMNKNLSLRDIVIASGASTDSSVIKQTFGNALNFSLIPDFNLLNNAITVSKDLGISIKVGNVFCTDRFYNDYNDPNGVFGDDKKSFNDKLCNYGILAVEMESAALYLKAAESNVQALAIFTVSDLIHRKEFCSPEEREASFTDMVMIALETIIVQ